MKTSVEQESPTKRRLVVEAESDEVTPYYDRTIKRLAGESKIPGFRKGKVPKTILETRLGKDTIREEFLRDVLPVLYGRAAEQESLKPITYPDIEVTSFEVGGPLSFTATLEVRPEIMLPMYKGIEVTRPLATATDTEVEEQLERLRERFGTLEPVGRNATKDDHVTIDLFAYRHDEKIDAASAEELLYEVGSATIVPELDTEIEGKRAGDILKFNAKLPDGFPPPHGGEEVSFQVVVKEVQLKKLPPLDDEFAKIASEFDTLDELKVELKTRIETIKKLESDLVVQNRILEDLVGKTELTVPDSMIAHETELRLARLLRELERAGVSLEKYLESNDATQEQLVESYRDSSEKTVAADLILDKVAEAEQLEVKKEDLDKEIADLSRQTDRDPDELLKELIENGRVNVLAGDILRRKALMFLMDHAKVEEEQA